VKWIHQLPRWTDPTDTSSDPIVWSGPVLVSDRLILVSSSGYAASVSPYTGALIGQIEIPSGAYIAPVVANDTLYILTNDADLCRAALKRGRLEYSHAAHRRHRRPTQCRQIHALQQAGGEKTRPGA